MGWKKASELQSETEGLSQGCRGYHGSSPGLQGPSAARNPWEPCSCRKGHSLVRREWRQSRPGRPLLTQDFCWPCLPLSRSCLLALVQLLHLRAVFLLRKTETTDRQAPSGMTSQHPAWVLAAALFSESVQLGTAAVVLNRHRTECHEEERR